MWRLWIHMGPSLHPEGSLAGFIDVPADEVKTRIKAVHMLGGKVLQVEFLDNDDER